MSQKLFPLAFLLCLICASSGAKAHTPKLDPYPPPPVYHAPSQDTATFTKWFLPRLHETLRISLLRPYLMQKDFAEQGWRSTFERLNALGDKPVQYVTDRAPLHPAPILFWSRPDGTRSEPSFKLEAARLTMKDVQVEYRLALEPTLPWMQMSLSF